MFLFALTASPAFAAEYSDADKSEGIAIIDQANAEIDQKIEEAVTKANQLTVDYINKIRGNEAVEISNLELEIQLISSQLDNESLTSEEVAALEKQVTDLQTKIAQIQERTNKHILEAQPAIDAFVADFVYASEWTDEQLLEASQALQSSLKGKFQIVKETQAYMRALNQVIDDCYNVTLAISTQAIAEAAEKGIIAECSWVLVNFGYKSEWIDPIKIVGGY